MSPERHARLMALFDIACELATPEARAFVERLGAADDDLREPLWGMLEVDRRSQVFYDQTQGGAAALLARDILQSALGGTPARPLDPGAVPEAIGEYQVLERLGAGAMGTVYRARQVDPERVVALKTLHPWLVSAASLERFRFEAQALASLTHPGIPPVYAVGRHQGTLYFAMELVQGPSLAAWAQGSAPSTRERVALLARVAETVHHAHLRGFVHRDLKPDNIRVTADGSPRVLDFGISAALGARAPEVSGTPAYMSPEQVEPGALVDVRSDVFSLGVIAFELLTGRLPAVPPGSGLATLQALKRQPSPPVSAVAAGLGRDLELIVARALQVEPAHRYASAAELASDLRAWLDFRPVAARAGATGYRARLFVRRNPLLVGALATTFLALAVGGAVALLQSGRAEAARAAAEASAARAAADATRARATLDFLSAVLAQADPEKHDGRATTVGQALDRAAGELERKALDPLVASSVHASLAETYMGLGEWKAAHTQAQAALAVYQGAHLREDELLPRVLILDVQVLREEGRSEETLALGARALAAEQALHGERPHRHLAYALHVQAVSLREAGQLAEALGFHRRAVAVERALAEGSADTGSLGDALNQEAQTLVILGRYQEAEPLYLEALRLDTAQYGPRHPEVAIDYHHLAWLENERDQPERALALLDRALGIRLETLGPDHTRVGIQRNLEALVRLELGDLEGAEGALEECLRIGRRAFGHDYGRLIRMEQTLVLLRLAEGRPAEAVSVGRRVLAAHEQRYGPRHWATEVSRSDLAAALLADGHREEAVQALEEALEVFTRTLGPSSRPTRLARQRLAQARAAGARAAGGSP